MQQENRSRMALVLAAGAVFLLAWLFVSFISVYRPSDVFEVTYGDGYLYGIESEEQYYRIFRVDVDSKESRSIRVPINRNGRSGSIFSLCPTEEGTVYVAHTYKIGQETKVWVEICDFDRRQLTPAWDMNVFGDRHLKLIHPWGDTAQLIFSTPDNDIERYVLEDGVWRLETRFLDLDPDSYLYEVTSDGGFYLFQAFGRFYRFNEEGSFDCIYEAGKEGDGISGYNYQFYKDEMYFEDINSGQTYRIDTAKAPYGPVPCQRTYRAAETFDEQRLSLISYIGKTVKVGVLALGDGRKVAAVCGENEYVAEVLEWGRGEKLAVWAILSLVLEGAGAFCMLAWKYMRRKEFTVPLVAEAALLTLILMMAGYWVLRNEILISIERTISRTSIASCIQSGYERMEFYDMDSLQRMCSFDQITKENQLPATGEVPLSEAPLKTDLEGNVIGEVAESFKVRLYFEKEGVLYPLDPTLYILNMPLEYNLVACDYLAQQAMRQALEKKQAVSLEYTNLTGRQYAVFLPFETGGDEYPIVLEVTMTREEGDQLFAAQAVKVERLLLFGEAALLFVILFVLWLGMRPLGVLKQAALQVLKGNLGAVAKVRGRSEAAKTALRFNHMSEQIAKQVYGVSSYQEKYAAFIPLDFLEKAGDVEKSGESLSGEVRQREYMVMTAGFREGCLPDYQDKQKAVAAQIERIHEKNGEILSFENEGLQCLFLGAMENALEAALNMLQDGMAGQESRLSIAISYEAIRLGITGNEFRSAVTAFNMNGDSNSFLKRCAEKYGASLLITGAAADRIPGFFDRYHVRGLGICLIGRERRAERIYEVLDGEPELSKRKKLLTRDGFAAGLDAFERREYLTARTEFIRVLSGNRQDMAALHYIRLCEENLSQTAGHWKQYLEIY